MNLKDEAFVTGELFISKNGELVQHVKNLVVSSGQNWIAQRMAGSTSPAPNDMSHMAIGQDTVAATLDDTTLRQELGRAGMSAAPQVTLNRVTFTATFKEGLGTGGVTEAGIFDAPSAGVMLARSVFPVVNKQIDDYITILWVFSIGTPL